MAKRWIQKAGLKKGALTEQADRAGESVQAFAEEHQDDAGVTGKRARLALTFKRMARAKKRRGG